MGQLSRRRRSKDEANTRDSSLVSCVASSVAFGSPWCEGCCSWISGGGWYDRDTMVFYEQSLLKIQFRRPHTSASRIARSASIFSQYYSDRTDGLDGVTCCIALIPSRRSSSIIPARHRSSRSSRITTDTGRSRQSSMPPACGQQNFPARCSSLDHKILSGFLLASTKHICPPDIKTNFARELHGMRNAREGPSAYSTTS